MKEIKLVKDIPCKERYNVIVAGGGVAGAAAAVAAARQGKSVLLIEKQINLGGLATTGLINLFTPMCNGRGKKIITGMAEEFLHLATRYGYDTIPEQWRADCPAEQITTRYTTKFSAPIFMLQLTELMKDSGVTVMFDSIVTAVIAEQGHIKGLVIENKSGSSYYEADMFVDTTGDCEVMIRAGVPCVQGKNYDTYLCFGADLKTAEQALEAKNMARLLKWYTGNNADLYGRNHPNGKRYWLGTNAEDVNEYLIENQLLALEKIKQDKRQERDILQVPSMVQFRTTRHIDGDYTLSNADIYRHHDTSIGTICDFAKKDILYEVPYGTLVKEGFDNVITAGRSAAAYGYTWDVLRLIPPAILTGQAAGTAAAQAVEEGCPIYAVDVKRLQKTLAEQNVMIHFDDALVPADADPDHAEEVNIGHI